NVEQALLESNTILVSDEAAGQGSRFGDVTIAIDSTTGNPIIRLSGDFATVIIDTPNTSVELQSGSINQLTVNNSATNAKLNVAENADVSTLILDSNTKVTGNGTVKDAIVHVNGSTFDRKPEKLEVADGVTVEINDPHTETTEPVMDGNHGGGN